MITEEKQHEDYIKELIAFTEKQIRINTGLDLALVPKKRYCKEDLTPDQIVNIVCKGLKIPIERLTGKSRERPIPQIRQSIVYIIKHTHPDLKLHQIAPLIGCSHHTSVMHHDRIAEAMIATRDEVFMPVYLKACEAVRREGTERRAEG